ncbi:hypothetical protein [Lutispora saccharofermentans]|uniref:Ethanolamine utilization protein n=1 Tax=Lutispora saccharofermentans TaxID=3024236 RepID=A0ABT1NE72_9FIRM|nr:hypothetical protein [Lutispora saccharofermentans]MCQ1529555.1 hypothetical protein [Lutispora saccharofermentans]
MDTNILIDRVVKEVIKRIESSSPKIMLIGKGELAGEELGRAAICHTCCEGYSDDMPIDDYDFIIIRGMSIFELVSSALLVPGTNVSKLILKGRLTGKKIYVEKDSMEYKKYESTIDRGLEKQLEHYEDCLKSYGIKMLKAQEIIKDINDNGVNDNSKNEESSRDDCKSRDQCRLDKKLITEQDLRRLAQQGHKTIQISKGSIVTPLARDFMKTNNMSLFKE